MGALFQTDVIVIGAGAAGLMCALEAGKRQRQVCVLDHANKAGKKILMSGGGRCNFTNLNITPDKYIGSNKHFCKSALSRYTQWHFIELVDKYRIPYHEKHSGQLFCDGKSKDILDMLLTECQKYEVNIFLNESILKIEKLTDYKYKIYTNKKTYLCESIVIATGGLSIPTMGASGFGYEIAKQFDLPLQPTRAGLVPLTLHKHDLVSYGALSGVSQTVQVESNGQQFKENLLLTHRGLSGPAILQISSYWKAGNELLINWLPDDNILLKLDKAIENNPNQALKTFLKGLLTNRLVEVLISDAISEKPIKSLTQQEIELLETTLKKSIIKPNGTEGYRTAEVTLGGVDCDYVSSKTFESTRAKGLYFIGEVLDVTGWLGGYNFQWAWSSGWAAGQFV